MKLTGGGLGIVHLPENFPRSHLIEILVIVPSASVDIHWSPAVSILPHPVKIPTDYVQFTASTQEIRKKLYKISADATRSPIRRERASC